MWLMPQFFTHRSFMPSCCPKPSAQNRLLFPSNILLMKSSSICCMAKRSSDDLDSSRQALRMLPDINHHQKLVHLAFNLVSKAKGDFSPDGHRPACVNKD